MVVATMLALGKTMAKTSKVNNQISDVHTNGQRASNLVWNGCQQQRGIMNNKGTNKPMTRSIER